jgi:membrane-bound lytic murein transglycosylase D
MKKFCGSILAASVFLTAQLFLAPGAARARLTGPEGSSQEIFPSPPALQENVDFWRDVFARYKTSEVVFHDEVHLGWIYGILHLGGPWMGTGAQKKRIRSHRSRIKSILLDLAQGRMLFTPSGGDPLAAKIKKMFSSKPPSALREAAFRVRGQPGLKERFREGYVRSGRYLARFREIFRRRGVPEDLTLLPHVESGFRSAVYSHAGALGLWQFTRGTGRLFMRVDGTVDGRRDPYLAADAAAKLLKRNYEDLKSWPLAITAYNHGSLGMRRAAKQVGSRRIDVIVKNYKSRTFGFASRNFYAEFLAARDVHKNAKKYFGALAFEPAERFDEFHIPGFVRFADLARRIGVDMKILRRMNPALRPSVVRGRRSVPRGYSLRLPAGEISRVRQAYFKEAPPGAAAEESSNWVLVRPGDTLGGIARRNRVNLKRLMDANGLERSLIIVGDRLRIPGKGAARKGGKAAPAAKSRIVIAGMPPVDAPGLKKRAEAEKRERPKKKISREPPPSPVNSHKSKIIWASTEYDLPAAVLSRGSPIREEALRQAVAALSPSGGEKTGWIRVQENETIGHFSRWLRVSLRRIRQMNGIRSNRRVRLGRKIRVSFNRVAKTEFLQLRIAYHKSVKESFFKKYSVAKIKRHKLKKGENVWTLLMRTYKVPLWLVRQYNAGKNLRRITAGDELVVPVLERRKF